MSLAGCAARGGALLSDGTLTDSSGRRGDETGRSGERLCSGDHATCAAGRRRGVFLVEGEPAGETPGGVRRRVVEGDHLVRGDDVGCGRGEDTPRLVDASQGGRSGVAAAASSRCSLNMTNRITSSPNLRRRSAAEAAAAAFRRSMALCSECNTNRTATFSRVTLSLAADSPTKFVIATLPGAVPGRSAFGHAASPTATERETTSNRRG
mmetsp:Transcript_60000/g.141971  ORF Transcript_60000/g.141971 Transcript_60000/m.141971 type:complete len:209 (-) Transcript_60000:93-719(-)